MEKEKLTTSDVSKINNPSDLSPIDLYQYDPTVDMSGYVPIEDRIKAHFVQKPDIATQQLLLNPQFKVNPGAIKEKKVIQLACQIENPHPYGTTTLGGDLSDPEYPDDFRLVGSSKTPKSQYCNSYSLEKGKTLGCLETHLHKATFLEDHIPHSRQLDGRCLPGQVVIKPSAYHCSDPECPFCARHWAGQLTAKAVRRIETFLDLNVNSFNAQFQNKTKQKGKSKPYIFSLSKEDYDLPFSLLVEIRHITVSIPKTDWKLPYKTKKKNAETVLFMAGAEGACQIYHPKRWSKVNKKWYYSPHFHFLAVVPGGWVDGQLVAKINKETGYLLKNIPGNRSQRKTQIKTLMYQLSHAGVPSGHQHAVTWIGCLAYNQLSVPKVTKHQIEEIKDICPLCQHQLRPVAHKSYSLKDKKQENPIWNNHKILNSEYDGKICLVPLDGWQYITRDGQKYDPETKSWSEQYPGGRQFDD